jgi:flagellar basal body-associated protein FliL
VAEEEEIIILEEEDSDDGIVSLDDEESSGQEEQKKSASAKTSTIDEATKKRSKKRFYTIIGISIFIFLLLLAFLIALFTLDVDDPEPIKEQDSTPQQLAQTLQEKEEVVKEESSKLDRMITKANILYEQGNKKEAMMVYEDIASFNEAISSYNIGVAQMKEKDFKNALENFKRAILNQEHRTVSAINAAVCSLELGDQELFKYYLDLAYAYLPEEANSAIFYYYVALINYYKNDHLEALSVLSNYSGEYYTGRKNHLQAKLYQYIGNDLSAISSLEGDANYYDDITLGLLYSRVGEYDLAIPHLLNSKQNGIERLKSTMALALAYNKSGKLSSSAKEMGEAVREFKEEAYKAYPIDVILKESLFDVKLAQTSFATKDLFKDENIFSTLFYFTPFKVFDAKQTMQIIKKGEANIYLDEISSAKEYLSQSYTMSKVNKNISKAIGATLDYRLDIAKDTFEKILDDYPKHSILHFNLGLIEAQMQNYTTAYRLFLKSYHLDSSNILAGIYAMFCARMYGKEYDKLLKIVLKDIENDDKLENEDKRFFTALAHILDNNKPLMVEWIEDVTKRSPLIYAFGVLVASKIKNDNFILEYSKKLKELLPKDIIANIVYIASKTQDVEQLAKYIQSTYANKELDYNALYYGPTVVRETYVKMLQIAGMLYYVRDDLRRKLPLEKNDARGIMQALAYISIYTKDYEQSYTLYNQLIDAYKVEDSRTLFLAAVASIGAQHKENAIALLELAKLTDKTNLESRYALGLLYQELENYEGAAIQYTTIGDGGFKSRYFSFRVNRFR